MSREVSKRTQEASPKQSDHYADLYLKAWSNAAAAEDMSLFDRQVAHYQAIFSLSSEESAEIAVKAITRPAEGDLITTPVIERHEDIVPREAMRQVDEFSRWLDDVSAEDFQ